MIRVMSHIYTYHMYIHIITNASYIPIGARENTLAEVRFVLLERHRRLLERMHMTLFRGPYAGGVPRPARDCGNQPGAAAVTMKLEATKGFS